MRLTLLSSTAVALVLALAPVYAQAQQQKGSEEKSAPQATEKNTAKDSAEPKGNKGSAQHETKGTKGAEQSQRSKEKDGKGVAQGSSSEKGTKGTSETQHKDKGTAQHQDKSTKGTAETQHKDQGSKGTAQNSPQDKGTKGTAQTQPKDQGGKGTAQAPQDKDTRNTASKSEAGGRVQLSEQQRTNVHETILKERNVNRVNEVNFSITVGTRIPHSVRLAALPASVISLVPQFRSYEYFVANDEICIVEPSSYEIVEVIPASGKTAQVGDRGRSGTLMLTAEEKHIIIENVEMRDDRTLALGSLGEGSPVPREARLMEFPDTVVEKVPKVRGHKYFTSEGRVAITDDQGGNIDVVIDAKR